MICSSVLTALLVVGASTSSAADRRAEVLNQEFNRLLAHVQTLEPDGKIGSFMKFKEMDGYKILWDLAPSAGHYDLIRLYSEHTDGTQNFAVSYYRSYDIVEGRRVIRRFVGPHLTSWRNDTADAESGEYLGHQGVREPAMNEADRRIIKQWAIELFP